MGLQPCSLKHGSCLRHCELVDDSCFIHRQPWPATVILVLRILAGLHGLPWVVSSDRDIPPLLAFVKEFLLCGVKLDPRMLFPGQLQVLQKGQPKSASKEM